VTYIVERLRGFWGNVSNRDIIEAADEIERLREALREISDLPNPMEDAKPSDYARGFVNGRYRAQDIARAALPKG